MSAADSLSIRDPGSWSAALWSAIEADVYPAVLGHPFITGLTDGSLAPEAFAHYVVQDVLYLREYARALTIVSAKAPSLAETAMFARHAAEVHDVELALHRDLLPRLGLDAGALAEARPGPTTSAYTSYLLATCLGGNFADGLAAVLPCYWIYARVGAELLHRGSPDPLYRSWIDSYGGEEFTTTVLEVLDLADHTGRTLTPEQERAARDHFVVASRYEWMFFDAALRREKWPI